LISSARQTPFLVQGRHLGRQLRFSRIPVRTAFGDY
jgi:hypothetical protein